MAPTGIKAQQECQGTQARLALLGMWVPRGHLDRMVLQEPKVTVETKVRRVQRDQWEILEIVVQLDQLVLLVHLDHLVVELSWFQLEIKMLPDLLPLLHFTVGKLRRQMLTLGLWLMSLNCTRNFNT